MKKIGKFLATTFSLAAILGGAYYFYEKFIKDSDDDFVDFDDFDDFDDSDDCCCSKNSKESRGYTTLNMDAGKADDESVEEAVNEANQEDEQEQVDVFDLNEEE